MILPWPDWVYNEIHFGEEQAGFRVLVHEIREEHTKFTASTQVSKKVPQKSPSIRDSTPRLLQQPLLFSQQDQISAYQTKGALQ
jgi:hypothetical protein